MFDDGLTQSELTEALQRIRQQSRFYSLCRIDGVSMGPKSICLEPNVRLVDYDKISNKHGLTIRGESPLPESEGIGQDRWTTINPYSLAPREYGNTAYGLVHSVWSRVHLETNMEIPSTGPDVHGNAAREFNARVLKSLESALAILNVEGWKLCAPIAVSRLSNGAPLMMFNSGWFNIPGVLSRSERLLRLEIGSGKSLRNIYRNIQIKANHELSLAIDRLNVCRTRLEYSDILIDAWIGLESLFGEKKDQSGAQQICIRHSCLVSSSFSKRKDNFMRLKQAYSIRNKIVHGKIVSPENCRAAALDALEALRSSLNKILSEKEITSRAERNEKLDGNVFW